MSGRSKIVLMSKNKTRLVSFLKDLLRRRECLPSQLAADLGVNHATVSRWLSGKCIPNVQSCRRLAEHSRVPSHKIFSIAGHLPEMDNGETDEWPEFSEYVRRKYTDELEEDLVNMIEDLLERRRAKKYVRADS